MATIDRRPYRDKARLRNERKRQFPCIVFVLLTMKEVRYYEIMASHICIKSEGSGILN